jgi:hypothetical protein
MQALQVGNGMSSSEGSSASCWFLLEVAVRMFQEIEPVRHQLTVLGLEGPSGPRWDGEMPPAYLQAVSGRHPARSLQPADT